MKDRNNEISYEFQQNINNIETNIFTEEISKRNSLKTLDFLIPKTSLYDASSNLLYSLFDYYLIVNPISLISHLFGSLPLPSACSSI